MTAQIGYFDTLKSIARKAFLITTGVLVLSVPAWGASQDFKGTVNGNTITAGTGTVTISVGKTLTVENNSLVNQDLTTDASPVFAAVKLSRLADGDYEALRLENVPITNGNTASPYLTFYSNPGNGSNNTINTGKIYGKFDTNAYASARITFATATGVGTFTDVLTIKNGNVGIGTTTAPSMLTVAGLINMKNYTVATLPAGTRGDICYVTDALAPTFLAAIVGGGAVVSPVFFNGAAWVGF